MRDTRTRPSITLPCCIVFKVLFTCWNLVHLSVYIFTIWLPAKVSTQLSEGLGIDQISVFLYIREEIESPCLFFYLYFSIYFLLVFIRFSFKSKCPNFILIFLAPLFSLLKRDFTQLYLLWLSISLGVFLSFCSVFFIYCISFLLLKDWMNLVHSIFPLDV